MPRLISNLNGLPASFNADQDALERVGTGAGAKEAEREYGWTIP
jgi:hypothetical protein